MKFLIWLLTMFITLVSGASAQTNVDDDLFDVDSNHSLVLKPAIERQLLSSVDSIVANESIKFNRANRFSNKGKTEFIFQDDSLFFADTFRIEMFVEAFRRMPSGATTMSMNWVEQWHLKEYEALLSIYLDRTASVLNHSANRDLIHSQEIWQEYYKSETDFIFKLNYFGNHNSYLYNWIYYLDIVRLRLYFVRDIYLRRFYGSNVYKED